jgi:hypothetical protein
VDAVIEISDEPTRCGLTFVVLLDRLRDRGSQLYVAPHGRLHYVGVPLAPDDSIQIGINGHLVLLTEAFTYVPGGRCTVEGCYRLRAEGSTASDDHVQHETGSVG